MEQLFTFWKKYMLIPQEVRSFVENNAEIVRANKGEYYIESIEVQHHWCFILDGIVAEYRTSLSGKQIILAISVGNSYFTGTKHPFTNRRENLKLKFLTDSKFIQIPNHIIQFAQKEFPSVSELLHTLKQKKIMEYQKMHVVLTQDTKTDRYIVFQDFFSHLLKELTVDQKCAILNMDKTTYYRAVKVFSTKNKI